MKDNSRNSLKASSFAALALAFASFGDAFLYPFLPVNFADVGIPVAWVGVILSINRFVRIVSNTVVVHLFARHGLRTIMIVAVALAITSTLGYGVASGITAWLAFRILWGLAFSAMRIGTLGYALGHERQGIALGFSRGLQEMGPMAALFLAPVLLKTFRPELIFYLLAILSMPALYFVFTLPRQQDKTPAISSRTFFRWPTTLNLLTLISAIIIDGIVVVVLGILFIAYGDEIDLLSATTMAALYLGYRRICLVVLSPMGGWLGDLAGLQRIFNYSMAMVILGLVVIFCGWVGVGAVIVFTFYSISASVTPGASINTSHALASVAENATWRDIGAAVGTLLGGLLITSEHLTTTLLIATFVMVFLLLIHLSNSRGTLKLFSYGSHSDL